MKDIDPCPRCGSIGNVNLWRTGDGRFDYYYVYCHQCLLESKGKCEKEEAINQWNNL